MNEKAFKMVEILEEKAKNQKGVVDMYWPITLCALGRRSFEDLHWRCYILLILPGGLIEDHLIFIRHIQISLNVLPNKLFE